ncbi:MAG: SET domain-containing protein-lysine N-methyltransferase [Legionellales bacterium]|nr:SET domain-containing protein-lysine N-methyltransferase [Legionellales bacterium]
MRHPNVTFKKSRIHRYGLYAKKALSKGDFIIEYTGKKITKSQSAKILTQDLPHVYIFELNQRYDIDGDTNDNIAKYINHSCDPNCYTDIVNSKVWIVALRDIKLQEELSYDYGFARYGWEERPCRCGSSQCFGFMVARQHWGAIKKTKRYQQLVSVLNRQT